MVDYSRRVDVKCVKSKNQVKNSIQEYIAEIERESEKRAKRFRTDKGLEFCNKEIATYILQEIKNKTQKK